MECPNCAHRAMTTATRDHPFTYKGEAITVKATGEYCSGCNEFILSNDEWKRVDGLLKEFVQGVNARTSDPRFIRDVRKKLNLDQQEAGRIFGGGVNAFSRYETGKTEPPQSLMVLLRLLDHRPELLDEIKKPTQRKGGHSSNSLAYA